MDNNKNIQSKKIIKNLFMLLFYFLYSIIILVLLQIFNIDTSNFNNTQKNIYLITTDAIYLIIVLIVYKNELINDVKKIKDNYINKLIKYFPIYILGVILMAISNIIISNITNVELSNNEVLVREYISLFPIYMAFTTVVYAPIVEEITFRKTFRNIINNKYIFIIISGLVFGLVHLSSSFTINDYLMIIPYILIGIVLSYIYYDSDNILMSISLHSIYNLILFIIQIIGG